MQRQRNERRLSHVLRGHALVLGLTATSGVAHALVIDDFSVDQALISADGAVNPASSAATGAASAILGGERDMEVAFFPGFMASGAVNGSSVEFDFGPLTTGTGLLTYDGPDGLPAAADLDHTGLGGVDLTVGMTQDALSFRLVFTDAPATMVFTVYTDAGNYSSFAQPITTGLSGTDFVIPYAGFVVGDGNGADFAQVGAITVLLSGLDLDTRFASLQTASTQSPPPGPAPAPEGATLTLLGLGLAGLGFVRRRSRSRLAGLALPRRDARAG